MMKIRWLVLRYVLYAIIVALVANVILAQQHQKLRQTDPQDMDARHKIDDERWLDILLLDRQIQADTVLLAAGGTQVVYLDRKYPDTDYQIFVELRTLRGSVVFYRITPTTDSSFTITKHTADVSTIQYMTIHKGD